MTPREYFALKYVWAAKEAQYHNTHFDAKDLPYIAEDFVNPSARIERKAKMLRERADTMMEKQRLDMMKTGDKPGSVPEAFMVIGKVN